jgi:hypothetical protein
MIPDVIAISPLHVTVQMIVSAASAGEAATVELEKIRGDRSRFAADS